MAAIRTHCPLPDDLIIEILSRLPVKMLLQFKSVCKQWNAIIKDPTFIRRQFHSESNCTRLLVYLHARGSANAPRSESYFFALFPDETLERHVEPDHLKLPGLIEDLRGPCNGIFCVLNTARRLAMWNPATRRMRPLPFPPQVFRRTIDEIGFGIDPFTDEFKIVLIIGESSVWCHLEPCYAVYSSNNDSWKYYEDGVLLDSDSWVFKTHCGTTFLNGFYYWVKGARKENHRHIISSIILAFDMHNEVFQEIEMPETLREAVNKARVDGELCLYNDSLAWFSYDVYNVDDKHIDIWVMKEKGCWTKLLTCILPFKFYFSLGFWMSKKFFLLAGTNRFRELMMYDPDSCTTRNISFEKGEVGQLTKLWPRYYKESLVSVDGDGTPPDYDIQSEIIRKFLVRKWPGHRHDPE